MLTNEQAYQCLIALLKPIVKLFLPAPIGAEKPGQDVHNLLMRDLNRP